MEKDQLEKNSDAKVQPTWVSVLSGISFLAWLFSCFYTVQNHTGIIHYIVGLLGISPLDDITALFIDPYKMMVLVISGIVMVPAFYFSDLYGDKK